MWVVTTLSTESLAKPTQKCVSFNDWFMVISRNPRNARNRCPSSQTKGIAFWQFEIPHRRAVEKSWGFFSGFPLPSNKSPHFRVNYNRPNKKSSWVRLHSFITVNSDITTHDGLTRGCSYWWFRIPRAPATARGGKSRWRGLGLGKEDTSTCGSRSRSWDMR